MKKTRECHNGNMRLSQWAKTYLALRYVRSFARARHVEVHRGRVRPTGVLELDVLVGRGRRAGDEHLREVAAELLQPLVRRRLLYWCDEAVAT